MLESWVPVLIFFILVAGFGTVSLILSYACGPKKPDARKLSPYECGMHPVGTARERFSVKFYLVAMLFIIFDIETVFLIPWSTIYFGGAGSAGGPSTGFLLVEMLVFMIILAVGYVYVWKRGALQWD